MDEISERIKELIDNSGLTHKEFAEKIEVSPAIISHILSGRNKPSLQVVQRITNVYTNVNLNYLLSGAGELYRTKPSFSEPEKKEETSALSTGFNDGVRPVAPPDSTPLARKETSQGLPLPPKEPVSPKQAEEQNDRKTNVNNSNLQKLNREKQIERVIIFYSDKTMEEYRP